MPYLARSSSALPERGKLPHRQLVDLDAVHAEFARHGVAQAAFGVMILHRHDRGSGLLRGGLDDSLPSGLML